MSDKRRLLSRRDVLKGSAALGAAALMNPSLGQFAWAASKDRVFVYNSSTIDNLHPYDHSSSALYGIWQHMMEPLVVFDHDKGRFAGRLAESWEYRGKEWEFKLRKGIKFHDGSPFTSADVAFSINRAKTDKKSLQRRQFRNVQEVLTPDEHTVVVVTKKPSVTFLTRGVRNRYVMSKTVADKYGKDVDKHPAGTGPYKFVSFRRDGDLVLTRNDDYWGPKPAIKDLIWRKVVEVSSRMAGLESGQCDVIDRLPVHEVERINRHPRVGVRSVPGLRIYFFAFNVDFKPWDNKLVRQAANYSVDADAIVKGIFDGNGEVLQGPVGPRVIGHNPNVKRYPYDPKKARELLAKAGHPNGIDVKLHSLPGQVREGHRTGAGGGQPRCPTAGSGSSSCLRNGWSSGAAAESTAASSPSTTSAEAPSWTPTRHSTSTSVPAAPSVPTSAMRGSTSWWTPSRRRRTTPNG